MTDTDTRLRRFELDIVLSAAALALVALVWPGSGPWMAVAVLAGGGLAWFSFSTLKASADAILGGGRRWASLVKIFTRYGILAVAAYVILARLRLPPLGVFLGVSSLTLGAVVTAIRLARAGGSAKR